MAPATIGDNGSAGDLKRFVERIEKLEEEKSALALDIKAIYEDAKRTGFDVKILRTVIKERQMDAGKLAEREELLETYRRALGMLSDTPLGKAALEIVA